MKRLLIAAALLLPLAATAAPEAPADKALIERGRYISRAADCVACHSIEGSAPMPAACRWSRPSAPSTAPTSARTRSTASATTPPMTSTVR